MTTSPSWGISRLGEKFDFIWDEVPGQFRLDQLDGTVEPGHNCMDLRIWWGGDEIRLDRLGENSGTNLTINDEEVRQRDLPRDQQERLIDWELLMLQTYLEKTGADLALIERWWGLEGVLAQKGQLTPERGCPQEEM